MNLNLRLGFRRIVLGACGAGLLSILSMLASVPLAAQSGDLIDGDFLSRGPAMFPKIWRPYGQAYLPQPNLTNSPRLTDLLREGKLALSLNDFLKLVVENSLAL